MSLKNRAYFWAGTVMLGNALGCSDSEAQGAPLTPSCNAADCRDASNGGRPQDDAGTGTETGSPPDVGIVEDTGSPDEATTVDRSPTADVTGVDQTGAMDRRVEDQLVSSDRSPPSDGALGDGPRGDVGDAWITADAGNLDDMLRLNDIQMEGSHNSYHIETTFGLIPAWAYTHRPLAVQLDMQGVRQFELDIHYLGPQDFAVHHVGPDAGTTCTKLVDCLSAMKTWSDAHPRHHPLVVLVEQKDELDPLKISGHYEELEASILSVWPAQRIITPDEVRGQRANLRDAVTMDGWPTLGKTRGRILFAFIGDSTEYMNGHPALEGRLVFPRATVNDPFAAVVLLDGAVASETEIAAAVRQGFVVRTRYNGEELRLDPDVVNAALRGGAHCISGDFPEMFTVTAGFTSRCNPVRAPAGCTAAAIEQL